VRRVWSPFVPGGRSRSADVLVRRVRSADVLVRRVRSADILVRRVRSADVLVRRVGARTSSSAGLFERKLGG
jgi:hypothetical protein